MGSDAGAEWSLVWADEFDVDGAPDSTRWNYEVQDAGWVNDELQAYTMDSKNVRVEGGVLILEAHKESGEAPAYTSGRIHGSGKGDVLYGRVDVRAKLPAGVGSWPAIWMFPTWPWSYGDWPDSGEIDIMEHVGHDLGVVHASVHTAAYNWPDGTQKTELTQVPTVSTEFHVYSLEWEEDELRVSVDGSQFFAFANEATGNDVWPFDQPFHLILNVAVGGIWGGNEGVEPNDFPLRMEVDYVRVYERIAQN
jgi:beta-glucanase (GH16 family)